MKISTVLVLTVAALTFAVPVRADGEARHQFTGAAQCKMCHNTKPQGKIFDKWMASKHAQAFVTLASEEAKKIATAKGIEDPQKSDACLKCHVTGHGAKAELLGAKYAASEGVTCESCHGAGGDYWKIDVMKGVAAGTTKAAAVGLTNKPGEKTCLGCHNSESPTFKAFTFKEFWAKIEHSIPVPAK